MLPKRKKNTAIAIPDEISAAEYLKLVQIQEQGLSNRIQDWGTFIFPLAVLTALLVICGPISYTAIADPDPDNRRAAVEKLNTFGAGLLGALTGGGFVAHQVASRHDSGYDPHLSPAQSTEQQRRPGRDPAIDIQSSRDRVGIVSPGSRL